MYLIGGSGLIVLKVKYCGIFRRAVAVSATKLGFEVAPVRDILCSLMMDACSF